jgi:hypothetical protein
VAVVIYMYTNIRSRQTDDNSPPLIFFYFSYPGFKSRVQFEWKNVLETLYSVSYLVVVYSSYMLYFKLSCVYGCLSSSLYCCSCLVSVVVVLLYYGCIVAILSALIQCFLPCGCALFIHVVF